VPELTLYEQEKFTKDDKFGRKAVQEVYEERLNQQNLQFDLYFLVNTIGNLEMKEANWRMNRLNEENIDEDSIATKQFFKES